MKRIKQGKFGQQDCCQRQSHYWDGSVLSQGFEAAFPGQDQDAPATCVTCSDTTNRLYVCHNNVLGFGLHSKEIMETSEGKCHSSSSNSRAF